MKLFFFILFLPSFLFSSESDLMKEIIELKNNKIYFFSDKQLTSEIIDEFKTYSSLFSDVHFFNNEQLNSFKKNENNNFLINNEVQNLKKIIIANGFCKVFFSTTIENNYKKVEINLGNICKIKNIFLEIDVITETEEKEIFEIITKEIRNGDIVSFKTIEKVKNKIFTTLRNAGYFFCNALNPEIEIVEDVDEVSLTFVFDAFEKNKINDIKINGLKSVKKKVLDQMITIKKDKILTVIEMNETKENIIKSNLFNSVSITPKFTKNNLKNFLDVLINVSESNHKSFGAGLYYYFFDGPQMNVFWEHRNFFGLAHKMGLKFSIGKREKSGLFSYTFPNFFSLKRKLELNLQFLNLYNIAYSGNKFLMNGIIMENINENFSFSFGPEFEVSEIKTKLSASKYSFINFYSSFLLKNLDKSFAPRNGIKFNFECIPSFGKILNDDFFLYKNLFLFTLKNSFVFYKSFINNLVTVSTFVSSGKIFKNKNKITPSDKRFYGGEKNQMRSYGYKMASPLNSNGEPIGGDSFLMFSFGPNFMVSKTISLGIFYEVNKVFIDKKDEDFFYKNEAFKINSMLHGVGGSFKYYFSEIFSINFDIGFPLKIRKNGEDKNVDSRFQIHFSIGETF